MTIINVNVLWSCKNSYVCRLKFIVCTVMTYTLCLLLVNLSYSKRRKGAFGMLNMIHSRCCFLCLLLAFDAFLCFLFSTYFTVLLWCLCIVMQDTEHFWYLTVESIILLFSMYRALLFLIYFSLCVRLMMVYLVTT